MAKELDAKSLMTISNTLRILADQIPIEPQPTARDWSGFFQALAAFAAAILPLIAPYLAEPKKPETK